jgi:hypothetical protein
MNWPGRRPSLVMAKRVTDEKLGIDFEESNDRHTPQPRRHKMTSHDFSAKSIYDIYRVTIRFRERLCGGMPKNPELIEAWVRSTTGHDDEQTKALTEEAIQVLVDEAAERSWNGFPGDAMGLFIWARQVKALFKECATMLRLTVDKRGSKQIFQHGFEIKSVDGSDRLHLGREKPDAYAEGPIHVQTAQGPRTALKRVDYVEGVTLTFDVWVLATHAAETRHIGEADVVDMLRFGQENGIGADRSQGMGKFDVADFQVVQKAARSAKDEPDAKPAKRNGKTVPATPS